MGTSSSPELVDLLLKALGEALASPDVRKA
jgi:hypothetical protein